jgi:hypothetical protein
MFYENAIAVNPQHTSALQHLVGCNFVWILRIPKLKFVFSEHYCVTQSGQPAVIKWENNVNSWCIQYVVVFCIRKIELHERCSLRGVFLYVT